MMHITPRGGGNQCYKTRCLNYNIREHWGILDSRFGWKTFQALHHWFSSCIMQCTVPYLWVKLDHYFYFIFALSVTISLIFVFTEPAGGLFNQKLWKSWKPGLLFKDEGGLLQIPCRGCLCRNERRQVLSLGNTLIYSVVKVLLP